MDNIPSANMPESQFIKDIEQSTIDSFNQENPYEQSFYNDAAGFVAAVNWQEDGHWLAIFPVIHVVYFSLVICFRRVEIIQLGIFFSICGLLFALEYVNVFLQDHWREFSTQNYFDSHGLFLGIMLAGPLLVIGFFQLILTLCYIKDMVIFVKRAELKKSQQNNTKIISTSKISGTKNKEE